MHFSADDRSFIDRAIEFRRRMDVASVLLLVGSRAAGYDDSWSDLDLWIIGDKEKLSPQDREKYETHGELFIDRGDYEAHWSFYDYTDISRVLQNWPDEKMWIILISRVLDGCNDTIEQLRNHYRNYPEEVVEQKLKCCFGNYLSLLGPLNLAARGMPESAFLIAGKVVEYLCKISCLAERKPFPYTKWLIKAAQETALGNKVCPYVKRAVSGMAELLHPPKEKNFRELIPLRELRATKDIIREGLKQLGWQCSWIDNTDEAVAEALRSRAI